MGSVFRCSLRKLYVLVWISLGILSYFHFSSQISVTKSRRKIVFLQIFVFICSCFGPKWQKCHYYHKHELSQLEISKKSHQWSPDCSKKWLEFREKWKMRCWSLFPGSPNPFKSTQKHSSLRQWMQNFLKIDEIMKKSVFEKFLMLPIFPCMPTVR